MIVLVGLSEALQNKNVRAGILCKKKSLLVLAACNFSVTTLTCEQVLHVFEIRHPYAIC